MNNIPSNSHGRQVGDTQGVSDRKSDQDISNCPSSNSSGLKERNDRNKYAKLFASEEFSQDIALKKPEKNGRNVEKISDDLSKFSFSEKKDSSKVKQKVSNLFASEDLYPANLPENIIKLVDFEYEGPNGRKYQGTNKKDAEDKLEYGIDPKRKKSTSATQAIKEGMIDLPLDHEFVTTALKHQYFTKHKHHIHVGIYIANGAVDYARLNAKQQDEQPALIRVMVPENLLETDPDATEAYRTNSATVISSGLILRASDKKKPSQITERSEYFRNLLNNSKQRPVLDVTKMFSPQEAADLLSDRLTPTSEDPIDFFIP